MIVKKTYPLVILIFFLGFFYILSRAIPEESIRSLVSRAGLWGPLVFALLSLTTDIIAPLSGTPLIFAGFYAFGSTVVFLMTISDFIASIVNFWIAKRWGRSLVRKFVGQENIAKVDRLTRNYGIFMLLLLRLFQGGIGDFVSYAAGLTSMRFIPYLIISTAGMIPRTILWYFLALQVKSPVVFTALTLLLIAVLSGIFLAGVAIKRFKR